MPLIDKINSVNTYFVKYLADNTLNTNAVGDYSNNYTEFKASPPIGKEWYIDTCTMHIKAYTTSQVIRVTGYGDGEPLTNGCLAFVRDKTTSNILLDFFDGGSIKRIVHWLHIGDTLERDDTQGSEDFINIKWHFYKNTGFYLKLTNNEEIVVTVRDNIMLDRQRFIIQGLEK